MKFKKVLFMGVISLTLLFTLTSVVVAEEMSGMKMDGNSTVQKSPETKVNSEDNKSNSSQTQPSGKANDHSNMDTGTDMPGMDSGASSAVSNKQHEATAGMDPNMSGMKSDGKQGDGHGEGSEESEGVNWMVVGSFLAINSLVIAIAGVLKFLKKTQVQILQ